MTAIQPQLSFTLSTESGVSLERLQPEAPNSPAPYHLMWQSGEVLCGAEPTLFRMENLSPT